MNGWVLLTTLCVALPAHATRYTLRDVVAKVSRESPQVMAARASVAQKKSLLLEQQMRWMPDGSATFSADGTPKVRVRTPPPPSNCNPNASPPDPNCAVLQYTNIVDLRGGPEETSLAERAPFNQARMVWGLNLTQPLFTSGKIEAAIGAARGGIEWEKGNAAQAELDAGVLAVRLYTQVRVARIALDATDAAIRELQAWERVVESALDGKNRQGFAESDLSRVRLTEVNNQTSRLSLKRDLEANLEALRALVDDPQADVDDDDFVYTPQTSDYANIDQRPEVWGSLGGLSYYQHWRRLQLRWMLPDVGFVSAVGGGWWPTGGDDGPMSSSQTWTLTTGYVGGAIRQPLDLGVRRMRYLAVVHEERMQQIRYRMGYAYWQLELSKARLDLHEAEERLKRMSHAEAITHGWYAAVDENLAMGFYPDGREIVEVMLNWAGFRIRNAQAIADTYIALATVQRLAGKPILEALK